MKTAVIGAGVAGLTVARMLSEQGCKVTVFDKSKGTGGRLSSRSHCSGWIDHGTPYLSLDDPGCLGFLRAMVDPVNMSGWSPKIQGQPDVSEMITCIGVPRTSAITRSLLGDLEFQPSTRIARLENKQGEWLLFNDGESQVGSSWDQVVVAVPAPQALALVRAHKSFYQAISKVTMEPCWVTAVKLKQPVSELPDVLIDVHPALRRVVHNSAKPGRNNQGIYVLQAEAGWSQKHLEENPEAIGAQLLSYLKESAAFEGYAEVLFSHRWRYAFTGAPLGQPALWDAEAGLGVCGDWCLGRSVAEAWRSGHDLACNMLDSSWGV